MLLLKTNRKIHKNERHSESGQEGKLRVTVPIAECYKAFQAEGPHKGRQCVFLRVAGCNLACEWEREDGSKQRCDTPFTVPSFGPMDYTNMEDDEIVDKVSEFIKGGVKLLVVTGGEPTLFDEKLDLILRRLRVLYGDTLFIEVETNGTRPPPKWPVNHFNVSLKLSTSGNPAEKASMPNA